MYRHLRQGHKRYRKGASSLRSPIKEARSIDERPAIVDSRERLGDWEADTVLGTYFMLATVAMLAAAIFLQLSPQDGKRAANPEQHIEH